MLLLLQQAASLTQASALNSNGAKENLCSSQYYGGLKKNAETMELESVLDCIAFCSALSFFLLPHNLLLETCSSVMNS